MPNIIRKINPSVIQAFADTREIFENELTKLQHRIDFGTATASDFRYADHLQKLITHVNLDEIEYIDNNVWFRKRFWRNAVRKINLVNS